MKIKIKLLILLLLLGTAVLLAKTWLVKVVRTDLRAKPDSLSATVAQLNRGDQVEMLKEGDRGWLLVKSGGKEGYLHRSAIESSSKSLTGLLPGEKGAKGEELTLAAKGFNEATEKNTRGSSGFNYNDLDWVLKQTVEISKVKKFIEEGKLK